MYNLESVLASFVGIEPNLDACTGLDVIFKEPVLYGTPDLIVMVLLSVRMPAIAIDDPKLCTMARKERTIRSAMIIGEV